MTNEEQKVGSRQYAVGKRCHLVIVNIEYFTTPLNAVPNEEH